jgi:putative addiction module component (TIGR02574 family)
MSDVSDRILDEALRLPIVDRARIAAELIASVDGEPDPDAERAWAAEVERRARRAIAGDSSGEDWNAVRQRIGESIHTR